MKPAVYLRYLDLAGQFLMLFPLLTDTPINTYFSVGGWQIGSFLVQAVCGNGSSNARKVYGWLLAVTGALVLIALASLGLDRAIYGYYVLDDSGFALVGKMLLTPIARILAVGSPFSALWYFLIGLQELRSTTAAYRHRREIHWKL